MLILAGLAGICLLGMVSIFTTMLIHIIFGLAGEPNGWVMIGSFVFWTSLLLWVSNRKE
jgi:hypothetical protein